MHTPFHRMIESQASRTPDAVALLADGAQTTYAGLMARVVALSRRLAELGAGPGERVVVALTRSVDLVVALLATARAGAAYVPVDLGTPPARMAELLADVDARVVVTDAAAWPPPTIPATTTVLTPADLADLRSHAAEPAQTPALAPEDPVYVIYTSGSTGRPKGVVATHGGLTAYLVWAAGAYCDGPPVGLLHTSVAYDLAVTSLWVPLLLGGTVVLLAEDEPMALSALPADGRPVLLKLTPSHVDSLTRLSVRTPLGPVTAVVGGEQLWYQQVEALLRVMPGATVWNEYGPTETVVGCCAYRVEPEHPTSGPVPIGRPIDGASVHVIGLDGAPVTDVGGVGELYVGGAGVALGYLRQPELTAERFVPDPCTDAGYRYRTGDLVRTLANGDFEYIGRIDDQLKVRGFRVEPGEIEARLRSHPDVSDAVVALQDGVLVGYVVGLADGRVLRAYLADLLPGYMVPAAVHQLDRLPLTANGKVDRSALPALVPDLAVDGEPPASAAEKELAAIWQEVLGIDEPLRRDADFFSLGGDSIHAIEAAALILRRLGVRIHPQLFLRGASLADLADLVGQSGADAAD